MKQPTSPSAPSAGVIYAVAAYSTWGFVPLFWNQLKHIPPVQILAHRILWSVAFFLLIFSFRGTIFRWWTQFIRKEVIFRCMPSAVAISLNWGLYIFAVNSGHALEASLGYFINPVFNVLIGTVFFNEKLRKLQWTAFYFAFSGVLLLTIAAGRLPWIALSLAATFSLYGVIRKKSAVAGTAGTAVESVLLIPIAACILLSPALAPVNVLELPAADGPLSSLLLLTFGGALTALPLVWFSEAAQRLPLSTLGFYQYISPTFQFLIAVFAFGEPFGKEQLFSFLLIWTGLLFFVTDSVRQMRSLPPTTN